MRLWQTGETTGETTKAKKEGRGIIKNKKVKDENQVKLVLKEGISERKITFAKGIGGGETDFKGLILEMT